MLHNTAVSASVVSEQATRVVARSTLNAFLMNVSASAPNAVDPDKIARLSEVYASYNPARYIQYDDIRDWLGLAAYPPNLAYDFNAKMILPVNLTASYNSVNNTVSVSAVRAGTTTPLLVTVVCFAWYDSSYAPIINQTTTESTGKGVLHFTSAKPKPKVFILFAKGQGFHGMVAILDNNQPIPNAPVYVYNSTIYLTKSLKPSDISDAWFIFYDSYAPFSITGDKTLLPVVTCYPPYVILLWTTKGNWLAAVYPHVPASYGRTPGPRSVYIRETAWVSGTCYEVWLTLWRS
jgi:hypothetical protein